MRALFFALCLDIVMIKQINPKQSTRFLITTPSTNELLVYRIVCCMPLNYNNSQFFACMVIYKNKQKNIFRLYL